MMQDLVFNWTFELWRARRLAGFLLLALGLVGTAACLARPAPEPEPLGLTSTRWAVGAAVTMTVQVARPVAGRPVSVTILAPGDGLPQVAGREKAFFGLSGVQLGWLPPQDQVTDMQLAAAVGADLVGLDWEWRRLEPEPGQYVWTETDRMLALAKQYGLRLAPMLLYTPRWASSAPFAPLDYYHAPPVKLNAYRDFVYAVVNRYKPHGTSPLTADGYGIRDWVIWNEPNVHPAGQAPSPGAFWTGSLEAYIALLQAGYEGAHAADPDCNVLNGGLADVFWRPGEADLITALERLYDPNGDGNADDGGRPFFDTLNVHTYPPGPPEADWYAERLAAVAQVMARFGDEQKRVWITETGYGTAETDATGKYLDKETQADGLRMIYETCAAFAQVERVFWWSLRDYYSDASTLNPAMEAHHGLVQANWRPKPAFVTLGQLTGQMGQVLRLEAAPDDAGAAQVTIPAAFVNRPGHYVVFAVLDGLPAAVGLFEAAAVAPGG